MGNDGGHALPVIERLCRIKLAVHELEVCPEGACPFWEAGGAVVEPGCGLERFHLDVDRPDLAEYLVELRRALETAQDTVERAEARQALAGLVPPELSGR